MVIQSVAAPNVKWHIRGSCLTQEEVEFIQNFNPAIYHNDRECYLWAFDTKMPSGRWLENMRFNNALTEARAYVEHKEGIVSMENQTKEYQVEVTSVATVCVEASCEDEAMHLACEKALWAVPDSTDAVIIK